MYALFQDELDLSEPNKAAMLSLPKEKKWQIYCSKRSGANNATASTNLISDPEFYIEKVKALSMVSQFFDYILFR